MRLVKHSKVQRLRPITASVQNVLKESLSHAHELAGVIVIEIYKNKYNKPCTLYQSRMRLDTLTWAMRVADKRVNDILFEEIK